MKPPTDGGNHRVGRRPMALAGAGHGAGGPLVRQEGRRRHPQDKEGHMGRLDGKVALISGGARGQGATEAKLFAREGAKVVLGDIRDAEGHQVETEIRAAGGEATYMHLDVTSDADWVEAVGTATNRYGKLDILVNNAGIVLWKRLEETSEAEWDHLMAVNAKGVFLGTKHAIPALRRAGGGHCDQGRGSPLDQSNSALTCPGQYPVQLRASGWCGHPHGPGCA